jgi:uncharacterized phage protein gp47/JayE
VADFGVARQAATYASGAVTFGRYTATAQATIAPGTLIQSGDGTVQFQVVADTTQSAFSSALGVYVITAGTSSISATVQCLVAGLAGNVASGVVNTLGQAIAGVDYCTNALAFTNGVAAETDTALRTRFVAFLGSLARATKAAVGYAITSLSQTYTYAITEGYLPNGTAQAGYFYVVANDGTGAPSSGTLSAMTTAVNAVRACGIQFSVIAPTTLTINVAVTVVAGSGYTHSAVATSVQAAITAYIASLPIGGTLSYSRLYQVIYDATKGVASATALLVNSATADIAATSQQVFVVGTIAIG